MPQYKSFWETVVYCLGLLKVDSGSSLFQTQVCLLQVSFKAPCPVRLAHCLSQGERRTARYIRVLKENGTLRTASRFQQGLLSLSRGMTCLQRRRSWELTQGEDSGCSAMTADFSQELQHGHVRLPWLLLLDAASTPFDALCLCYLLFVVLLWCQLKAIAQPETLSLHLPLCLYGLSPVGFCWMF